MSMGILLGAAGTLGFLLPDSSPLSKIFCLEVLLLSATAHFVQSALTLGSADSLGVALIAIGVASAETAIGLSLVVQLYKGTSTLLE